MTALPPLGSLRAFEAAARLASFTRAATELHLTPSAVSHRIKALEQQLDVRLFERSGRSLVTLTREGGLFAARVAAAFALLAEATAELARARRNMLTVSVLPSFAARWLMPRIGRFLDRQPGLDLNIRSSTAHADFVRDGVDLAIRFGAGHWEGQHAELFMHDVLFPVCSPHLFGSRLPMDIGELERQPWLESDPEGWERWFAAAGVPMPRRKRRLDFGDASLALQAAIDGSGIAMARRSIAGRDLATGALVRLFPRVGAPSQYSYYFVRPERVALSPPALAFRAWIEEEARAAATSPRRSRIASRKASA
jgi:LysR family glycine cleavage system transcriptional activator